MGFMAIKQFVQIYSNSRGHNGGKGVNPSLFKNSQSRAMFFWPREVINLVTCRWAKKNLSPYPMAERSTKPLASKAFLVNHAEFEAFVSLRKDNFHKIWRRGNVVTHLTCFFLFSCILSESYKEWATCIKHHVQARIWKLEGNVKPLDLRYKIDFPSFSLLCRCFMADT